MDISAYRHIQRPMNQYHTYKIKKQIIITLRLSTHQPCVNNCDHLYKRIYVRIFFY